MICCDLSFHFISTHLCCEFLSAIFIKYINLINWLINSEWTGFWLGVRFPLFSSHQYLIIEITGVLIWWDWVLILVSRSFTPNCTVVLKKIERSMLASISTGNQNVKNLAQSLSGMIQKFCLHFYQVCLISDENNNIWLLKTKTRNRCCNSCISDFVMLQLHNVTCHENKACCSTGIMMC